jgi:hypothetical protein
MTADKMTGINSELRLRADAAVTAATSAWPPPRGSFDGCGAGFVGLTDVLRPTKADFRPA